MLDWIKITIKFLYDRRTRCRLLGMRPVVVCLIQSKDTNEFLMIRPSQKPNCWMPPQEGIEPNETIEKAAIRGLNSELGIAENQLHFRRSTWIGTFKILAQQGERDIQYSLMKMRGKAYYAALINVRKDTILNLNLAEVAEAKWQTVDEIMANLSANSARKQKVITDSFKKILQLTLSKS